MPFLTGSREAGFYDWSGWDKINKALTPPVKKQREISRGQHRFLLLLNQDTDISVDADSPQAAIKQAENYRYRVKKDLDNGGVVESDEPGVYNVTVYNKHNVEAYIDAPTEEEAMQHADDQGYSVERSWGEVTQNLERLTPKSNQTQKTQQPNQPSTFSGVPKNPKQPADYTSQGPGPQMTRKLNRKWRVTGWGVNKEGTKKPINRLEFNATDENHARQVLKRGGVKEIYELEVYDSQTAEWVEPSQLSGQTAPAQNTQQQKAASLEHHADLIRDILGMTRTADLVRQAARVAQAVQETVQADQDIDPVVISAVKQASQDILKVTDYLRQTNNRVAQRVASQIEQDFVDSLSFRIGA